MKVRLLGMSAGRNCNPNFLMDIEVSLASVDEKLILQNLMQYYLYEFSSIDGVDVDDDTGTFSDPRLDLYWIEAERYPFIVRVNEKLAGFALVRRGSYFSHLENKSGKSMTIAEFFVMEKIPPARHRDQSCNTPFRSFSQSLGGCSVGE